MDTSEQESNGNHSAEPFDDDSHSSGLPEICDIYDESFPFPRVGEQYQVEIPPAETKSVLFQIPYDNAEMPAIDKFGIGLAIPVNWVQCAVDNIKIKYEKEESSNVGIVGMKGSAHLLNTGSTQVDCKFDTRGLVLENPELPGKFLQRFACNVEFLNSLHQDIHVEPPANHVVGDNGKKDFSLPLLQNRNLGDFYPLPGLPTLSWSDAEKQSFLLGLYIFGKNLVQVKKFMETRRMGDVLSFYYGNFYRSDEYHRWSECRKIRSRRSIHGQRIFRGWRQQELLSRILNSTCKENQDTLLEAAKTFNEGRATLEKFVSKIKTAVGLHVLVEAIGIGKGTQDLTGVALDHARANPTVSFHPEIPVGRACSSLTSADIIKFLTGDFRLSKARSNDLFWEAVWPRLLARGWHSEQPRDHGSLGFKNSLVFLVTGVKKFSRKRLVKGTHFFDSVSDVLSKVASEPKLLELDVEGVKSGSSVKEGNGWTADAKVCQNGSSSNRQRHCYLHPRRPSCNSERMKFTVVDTSLAQKEGSFKVVEVRSLPLGINSSNDTFAYSQESRSESSSETEDSTDISGAEDNSNSGSFAEKKLEDNVTTQFELARTSIPFPNSATSNGYAPDDKRFDSLKDDTTVEQRFQNSWRVRSGQSNCSAPTIRRRNLTACNRVKNIQQDKREKISKPLRTKAAGTFFPDASPFQEKTNLYHNFMSNEVNGLAGMKNLPKDMLNSPTSFDLNNLPPDAVVAESSSNELKTEELPQSSAGKQHVGNEASIQNSNYVAGDEHPSTGIRRQSTRNRPPTAKALEALASGLLGTKRSWRPSNSMSKPTRKARKTYKPESVAAANLGNLASSTLSMRVPEIVSMDYVESTSKGTRELLGVP